MKQAQIWLGLVISLGLLILVFTGADMSRLGEALMRVNYMLLLLPAGLLFGTWLIRVWRWQILLRRVKFIGMRSLWSALAIGFMANMLLPARLGELARVHVLSRREAVSNSASLATVVVERLFDGFTILLLLVIVLVTVSLPQEAASMQTQIRAGGLFSFGFYLLVIGVLLLVRMRTIAVSRFCTALAASLPVAWQHRVGNMVENFASGLALPRSAWELVAVGMYSMGIWGVYVLLNQSILMAFGLTLPLHAAALVLVFQGFGVMIPSAPGFIGTFHAATMAALMLYGLSQEMALSVAIVMHAVGFFPTILVGLSFLWMEGLSFRSVRRG